MYSLKSVLENELKRIKPLSAVGLMYNEMVRLTLALVMGLNVIYELPPNKGVVMLIPKDTYALQYYVHAYMLVYLHILSSHTLPACPRGHWQI